jgi:hypothetical protein
MTNSNKPKAVLVFTDDFRLDEVCLVCQTESEVNGLRRVLEPFLLNQPTRSGGDDPVQNKEAHLQLLRPVVFAGVE